MIYKFFWTIRAVFYKLFFKKVGNFTYLGKPLYLHGVNKITLGSRVRIYPDCRMEVHGDKASITIEDNCSIGQRLHITASAQLVVSKNTTVLFDVMITDIDHEYQNLNIPIFAQPFIVNKTYIGENCFIGSGVKIQAGTILGRHCIVGANAVIRGCFPSYSVIVGVPGKVIKRYNVKTKIWEKTNPNGEFLNE